MITTLKVNSVAYIFPPERTCHRLRASLGFGYIAKFGTGVAFRKSGRVSSVITVEKPFVYGLNLGGTTSFRPFGDGSSFYAFFQEAKPPNQNKLNFKGGKAS
jgi:hypothetical protein